jgi:hypothetical protein
VIRIRDQEVRSVKDPRTEGKIFVLAALCGVMTALAFVVPRFTPDSEGGFAGAATAAAVFLGVLAAAAALSIYLFAVTIKARARIGVGAQVAGILPALFLVTGLVWLVVFLRY